MDNYGVTGERIFGPEEKNLFETDAFKSYEMATLDVLQKLGRATIREQREEMGLTFNRRWHFEALRRLISNGHITEGNEVCLTRYIFVTMDDPEKKVRSFNSEHAGVEFKPGDMAKMTRHKYAGAVVRVNV